VNYFSRISYKKFFNEIFILTTFSIILFNNISMVNGCTMSQNKKIAIILILGNTNFGCKFCMDSFIKLCDRLQESEKLKNSIYGVLCYDSKENDNYKENILIQKKLLRGFIKGNNIQFPFILDSSHVFKNFCNNGSQKIIIINTEKDCIRQWNIPLNPDQYEEIMNFILENDKE